MKVELGNILKLFLNFSNFEPQYSYRLYSYKKKECRAKIEQNKKYYSDSAKVSLKLELQRSTNNLMPCYNRAIVELNFIRFET